MKKDYWYVGVQLVLFALYVLPIGFYSIEIPLWLYYVGIILCVIGAILGTVALLQQNTKLSPFPSPVASGTLLTTGAYAISRHPIYTSILSITLGYALVITSWYKVFICLLLVILFYFKSCYEETLLIAKYPDYQIYKAKVSRFLSWNIFRKSH